jgi:hypothetical protein
MIRGQRPRSANRDAFAKTKPAEPLTPQFLGETPGIDIAHASTGGATMDITQVTAEITPCGSPLPELEIPMINTMVACLGSEHRRMDARLLPLALAASRLAGDNLTLAALQSALEVWNEIRGFLYSHLQIEDALVFSWGEDHQAISSTLIEALKIERQEMRRLVARVSALSTEHPEQQTNADRRVLAQTLLALARTLELHIARYDAKVLTSIRRSLFTDSKPRFNAVAEP